MGEKIKKIKVVTPIKAIRKVPLKIQVEELEGKLEESIKQFDLLVERLNNFTEEYKKEEVAYEITLSNLELKIDWYNLLPWYTKIWAALKGEEL